MNHEGGAVEETDGTGFFEDVAAVVDEQKEIGGDEGEVDAERIYPEAIGLDRISSCDVSSDSGVKFVMTEYSERLCKSELDPFSLLEFTLEDGSFGPCRFDALVLVASSRDESFRRDSFDSDHFG